MHLLETLNYQIVRYVNPNRGDKDTLQYFVLLINTTTSVASPLPNWIKFNEGLLQLQIQPYSALELLEPFKEMNQDVVPCGANRFCIVFKLRFTIKYTIDLLAQSVYEIDLEVYNTRPYVNVNAVLKDQAVHINQQIEVNIYDSSFKEDDKLDTKSFLVRCAQTADKYLPTWLTFYEPNKILGTPALYKDALSVCTTAARVSRLADYLGHAAYFNEINCSYQIIAYDLDLVSNASQAFSIIVQNSAPYSNRPLYQAQNKLGGPKNYTLHILDQLYYYFPDDSFVELDAQDQLLFDAYQWQADGSQSLTNWINFNFQTRQFFGQPSVLHLSDPAYCQNQSVVYLPRSTYYGAIQVKQLQCEYVIVVNASDGYESTHQLLNLTLYNRVPYQSQPIIRQNGLESVRTIHYTEKVDFFIAADTFTDEDAKDNGTLQYAAYYEQSPGSGVYVKLDDLFMTFNAETQRFYSENAPQQKIFKGGNSYCAPAVQPTSEVVTNWRGAAIRVDELQCNFTIKVTVKDKVEGTEGVFQLKVRDSSPVQYQPVYSSGNVTDDIYWHHVDQRLEFIMQPNTFRDIDNTESAQPDVLTYEATLWQGQDLPAWLTFDEKTLRFLGTPNKDDLIFACPSLMQTVQIDDLVQDKFSRYVPIFRQVCQINITINVSDSLFYIQAPYMLYIYNHAPNINKPLYAPDKTSTPGVIYWHVGDVYEYVFDDDCFWDYDYPADQIEYSASMQDDQPLEEFISFNYRLRKITGQPTAADLQCTDTIVQTQAYEGKSYATILRYCPYQLQITASDSYSNVSNLQEIRVYNIQPLATDRIYKSADPDFPDVLQVHVNTYMEYQVPHTAFGDVDNATVLKYRATLTGALQLPLWLSFNQQQRRFLGTPLLTNLLETSHCEGQYRYIRYAPPGVKDAGTSQQVEVQRMLCENSITVVADDGYDRISQAFTINIFNNQPYVNRPIYLNEEGQPLLEVHVDSAESFIFLEDCFDDIDREDELTYQSFIFNSTARAYEGLPEWIQFQPRIKQFYLTPRTQNLLACHGDSLEVRHIPVSDHLGAASTIEQSRCSFNVTVVCSDGYDSINQSFTIVITNNAPYFYQPLISHTDIFEIHVNDQMEHIYDIDCFKDLDAQDTLTYQLAVAGEPSLPLWIAFNADIRRISAKPGLAELTTSCPAPQGFYDTCAQNQTNELGTTEAIHKQICQYHLNLSYSDGTVTRYYGFQIIVTNHKPYMNRHVFMKYDRSIYNYTVHVGQPFDYFVPQEIFRDVDRQDALTYKI